MTFAGIDYDSSSIDVVRLELESDEARHDRVDLNPQGGLDALARARRVRDEMPARGAWRDAGVVVVALEDPKGNTFRGSVPLARVQGAILACLPPPGGPVEVIELAPYEWKKALGLSGNAKKEAVRAWVLEHWTNLPTRVGQDGLDAYAIAWAARAICEKAVAA